MTENIRSMDIDKVRTIGHQKWYPIFKNSLKDQEDTIMRIRKSMPLTLIISIVLIMIIAFCITETVISQSNYTDKVREKYYREMENTYVKEIRELLTEEGYENSGITMTRVTDENGCRTYTVTIHHDRINMLSKTEKDELIAECTEIDFPDKECSFCVTFHG